MSDNRLTREEREQIADRWKLKVNHTDHIGIEQCLHCRHYLPVMDELGDDWGVCANSLSPNDGLVKFEHDRCEFFVELNRDEEWEQASIASRPAKQTPTAKGLPHTLFATVASAVCFGLALMLVVPTPLSDRVGLQAPSIMAIVLSSVLFALSMRLHNSNKKWAPLIFGTLWFVFQLLLTTILKM